MMETTAEANKDKVIYWSSSRKDMYEQCPRRYDHRYNKHVPRLPGVEATCGNLAHEVLETYGRGVLDGKYPPVPDKLILYDLLEELRYKEEYAIVGQNIERVRMWLSLFDGDFLNTVAVECDFREENIFSVPVTGRIDRIDDLSKSSTRNGGHNTSGILVVDYKSGNFEKDETALHDDDQLGMYAVVMSRQYSGRPISVLHHYLESGRKVLVDFSVEEITAAHGRLSRRLDAVERGVRLAKYNPQAGWWCKFCERKIRDSCPVYPAWVDERRRKGWDVPV